MSKIMYEKESYEIRGGTFNVYNELGGGIKEIILERALLKELKLKGLDVKNQVRIDILYRGDKVGVYIPDIIVEDKIIVEIKSKPITTNNDKKQFWGYLKGSKYKVGFLINFSPRQLFINRFIYTGKQK